MKAIAVAAIAALALCGSAQASIIPVLNSVTADGSDFLYTYSADLSGDQGLHANNRFEIVDFSGYVAGSIQALAPNWTATIASTLNGGLLVEPGFTDDPSIPDLVFTYTGPDYRVTQGPYDDTLFTGFTAVSTIGKVQDSFYSSLAMKNTGINQDTKTFNVGMISVPLAAAVPEPATWAMFITGFFGMGMMMRRRKSSSPVATA